MFLSIALGVLVIIFVLIRQTRIRPVPRVLQIRLPIILGVLGLFECFGYLGDHHHPTTAAYLWVLGTLVIGAVGLGALRALSIKLWTTNNWVVRQGTPVTMVLWAISLALHFAGEAGAGPHGTSQLEQASLLLYLGLTLGVQAYALQRRAMPLWEQLGPEAGQRLQVNFGQGPGGMGTIFATFRGGGPGFGGGPGDDPDIIDADVVDDDDPPELPPTR